MTLPINRPVIFYVHVREVRAGKRVVLLQEWFITLCDPQVGLFSSVVGILRLLVFYLILSLIGFWIYVYRYLCIQMMVKHLSPVLLLQFLPILRSVVILSSFFSYHTLTVAVYLQVIPLFAFICHVNELDVEILNSGNDCIVDNC